MAASTVAVSASIWSVAPAARGFHVQLNAIGTLRGQGNSNGYQLLVQ
jgi:hypothetical protein